MSEDGARRRRTRAARRTNVVDDGEVLLGRAADLAAIAELFDRGARLVSVVAAGGMGKTRLSRRFVLDETDAFSGAWFCDLTEAKTAADIAASVATAMGAAIPKSTNEDEIVDRLGRNIAQRGRTLFVIDNCEHIVDVVASVLRAWLATAADARFLTTTRIALALPGEHRWPLEPLSTAASVELFIQRAQRVRPALATPSERDRQAIADVVARLDGMPLAIELAAARVSVLSPSQIRDRLDAPLDLLVRRGDDRHASMRTTIEDSVRMLGEAEQRLFASLAAFSGGFSLADAERVLGVEVFARLDTLVEASLLRNARSDDEGEVRLSFYETIREVALERFAELPARDSVSARHASHFAERARRTRGDERGEHRRSLADLDNFVAAHAHPSTSPSDRLAIALALVPVLLPKGLLRLLFRLLDEAILATHERTPELAEAIVVRGLVLRELGDLERARAEVEAGLVLAREANAPLVEMLAAARLAELVEVAGDTREAAVHLRRGLERLDATAPSRHTTLREADLRARLGHVFRREADLDAAEAETSRAVALYRMADDDEGLAMSLYEAAVIALFRQRYDESLERFDEGLTIVRRAGAPQAEGALVSARGTLLQERGDLDGAIAHQARSLLLFQSIGNRHREAASLYYLARAYLERGDVMEAERLLARALHLFRIVGVPRYEALVEACRAILFAGRSEHAAAADGLASARRAAAACGTEPSLTATLAIHEAQAKSSHGPPEATLAWARALAKAHPNDDPRFALRMLERATARSTITETTASGRARAFLVEEDGGRFRLPHADTIVDLSRRAPLKRMLRSLAVRRIESPSEALALDDLVAAAWPGERMAFGAAANRVYVALATLRKLGLRDILLSVERGYLLSPGVEVVIGPIES
jgi:predicted ATPase